MPGQGRAARCARAEHRPEISTATPTAEPRVGSLGPAWGQRTMTSSRYDLIPLFRKPATLRHTVGSLPKATRLDGCEVEHGLPGAAQTQHGVRGGRVGRRARRLRSRAAWNSTHSCPQAPGTLAQGHALRAPSLPSNSRRGLVTSGEPPGGPGVGVCGTQTEPTHLNPTFDVKK